MPLAPGQPVAYDIFINMELTLNLVWVCVAIVGIGLLCRSLFRAAACPDRPASNWRTIVAMSCALVILFFVISMTDDLHDQEIVVEESKSLRIVPGTGASSQLSPDRMVPIVFLLNFAAAGLTPALPAARRLVEPPELLFVAAIDCDRLCGRAPPASLA
jgi:hypothetical protein